MQQVTNKQKQSDSHQPCYYQQCDCNHYNNHPQHDKVPWIACYTNACDKHFNEKAVVQYWPKQPMKARPTCPYADPTCACSRYPQHPDHASMHWTKCFKPMCLVHRDDVKQFNPSPKIYQILSWEHITQLTATQHGFHLNLKANILGQPTKVMVDSGATGNFMNPRFQQKLGILGIEKPEV